MQEEVLDFIYNAYHDQTGKLEVPRSLSMKKDMSDRREIAQLKIYRPQRGYAFRSTLRPFIFIILPTILSI